jgi:hypothetical protein
MSTSHRTQQVLVSLPGRHYSIDQSVQAAERRAVNEAGAYVPR